jgi:hypothetical protein
MASLSVERHQKSGATACGTGRAVMPGKKEFGFSAQIISVSGPGWPIRQRSATERFLAQAPNTGLNKRASRKPHQNRARHCRPHAFSEINGAQTWAGFPGHGAAVDCLPRCPPLPM